MSLREREHPVRDAARALVGALLLGTPLALTMEMWWLGWTLPAWLVLAYVVGGLAIVSLVVHQVGFREGERSTLSAREHAVDFLQLVATSFVASFAALLFLGIVDRETSLSEGVRAASLQVLPFGFGAAITDRALEDVEEGRHHHLVEGLAIFAGGALFFSLPIAPTEEIELIAAHAGFLRLALFVPATIALGYVVLHIVGMRGEDVRQTTNARQWRQSIENYGIALAVATLLLAGFGHFLGTTLAEAAQEIAVLSYVAFLGGTAARVIL